MVNLLNRNAGTKYPNTGSGINIEYRETGKYFLKNRQPELNIVKYRNREIFENRETGRKKRKYRETGRKKGENRETGNL